MKTFPLLIAMSLFTLAIAASALAKDQPGLKFTELPSANSPLITFRIILRAGSINDPAGKEGLNALTASLISNGGTKELTYSQVVEKLYPWAADIGAQSDQEITTYFGQVHRDHLDNFYKLFSQLLLQPRFDPSDFKRLKEEAINHIQNDLRSQADEELGKQSLSATLFENHPYGKLDAGTVQGLTSITLDDVKDYYQKNYTQANLWFGIAGGYPPSLIETVKNDFSSLPAGAFKEIPLGTPAPVKDMEVMIVEKPTHAYGVSMGYSLPITRKDKDFYALMVANSYFGEHRTFNGVLMNRLRGDRGLNYGDYSYIEKFEGGLGSNGVFPTLNTPLRQQYFSIWLRPIPADNTLFGIRNALFELKNLVDNGISKDNFEQMRKFVVNYSKLAASTMSRRLGYMMDSEFYGSDYFIDRIERELSALTVDDVNAAIKKYLHPSDIKIVAVVDEGKGQELLDAMKTNKPSPIKYQSPVSQTILDQDKLIEVFPLTVNAAKSKVVNAKELFER